MNLNPDLLKSLENSWQTPELYSSCWNTLGLYSPMNFVLRLRNDVRRELQSITPGVYSSGELPFSGIQAFSTYLHETIHWWQHIGSTLGLMLSLSYPAQAHINHGFLKALVSRIGPVKSVYNYYFTNLNLKMDKITQELLCRILNFWHDLESCRGLAINPLAAQTILRDKFFLSIGHSYHMTWASNLALISSIIENPFEILPDARRWDDEFLRLKYNQFENYAAGSQIKLSPIGTQFIFESQARFSQIQYLFNSSGKKLTWEDFEANGMLSELYTKAFNAFLTIVGESWPDSPDSPLVGLFLLICDLSMNPGVGFPFDIQDFTNFFYSVDPGIRFLKYCYIASKNKELQKIIVKYSKSEYIEATDIMSKNIGEISPYKCYDLVSNWTTTHIGCRNLLEEDLRFDFGAANLPIRVLFARFLRLQTDKFSYPHFFCWVGMHSACIGSEDQDVSLSKANELFETHRALFIDGEDGDIYPRSFDDKDEIQVQKTFDAFYSSVTVYDIVRQWIMNDGDFTFDYFWLTSKTTMEELKGWASKNFETAYGIRLESFDILPPLTN